MKKIYRNVSFLSVFVVMSFFPSFISATEKKTDDKAPCYLTNEELDKKLGVDEKVETPEVFVWVVYFHRVPGCDTCQTM